MFRFTIRELVMLTAIVGLALGWGLDHWRLIWIVDKWNYRAEALAQVVQDGVSFGNVHWNLADAGFEIRENGGGTTVIPAP